MVLGVIGVVILLEKVGGECDVGESGGKEICKEVGAIGTPPSFGISDW